MPTKEITPVAYYRLCDRAAAFGIPTSLDDPASPATVDGLLDAVVLAEQRAWVPGVGEVFPLREKIAASYGL
jgi:hypothetical protein